MNHGTVTLNVETSCAKWAVVLFVVAKVLRWKWLGRLACRHMAYFKNSTPKFGDGKWHPMRMEFDDKWLLHSTRTVAGLSKWLL